MVKPFVLAIGAIPVIFALLIVIPMLTSTDIPTTAINPSDKIQIEFTKHDLRIVSFGVTEKTVADTTQILTIENDGTVQYTERMVTNLKSQPQSVMNSCKNLPR